MTRCPRDEPSPLSLVQEQVWRRAVTKNDVPSFYNESITLHRIGDLESTVLEHSFTEIIRRHEAWRTTFDTVDGQAKQVIHEPPVKFDIPFIDLRGIPEGTREREALRLATEDAGGPFDLKQGPLVRALVITIDNRTHRLFLTMHQCITDGVSVYQIFPSELAALYAAFAAGQPSPLAELPIQYADFAHWERQFLQENILIKQLAYWRAQLSSDLQPIEWPRKRLQPSVESFKGAICGFTLSKSLRNELINLSRREGVTLFTTLLAGFAMLLFSYTGQRDIITGTVAPAGRKRTEVQKLLGYFLNPVMLRIDLSGNPTLCDILRQCREIIFGALSNDDVPLEYVIEGSILEANPVDRCPFNTVITLAPPKLEFGPGWHQTPMDVNTGWARWDLYLELSDCPAGIIGRAQYKTDVFTPSTIARSLQDFIGILEALTIDAGQRISKLPFSSRTAS